MILFCEYVIPNVNRELFLDWVVSHPELWHDGELLENTGQPGVFVEIWRTSGEEEAARKQEERLQGRSEWSRMELWVRDGREGLRLWTFRPITGNG